MLQPIHSLGLLARLRRKRIPSPEVPCNGLQWHEREIDEAKEFDPHYMGDRAGCQTRHASVHVPSLKSSTSYNQEDSNCLQARGERKTHVMRFLETGAQRTVCAFKRKVPAFPRIRQKARGKQFLQSGVLPADSHQTPIFCLWEKTPFSWFRPQFAEWICVSLLKRTRVNGWFPFDVPFRPNGAPDFRTSGHPY